MTPDFLNEVMMMNLRYALRGGAFLTLFGGTLACSTLGSLGGVLGGGGNQVTGTVQGVNTRTQQLGITNTSGQTVTLTYDNNTRVVYQDRNYPVTALEWGDEVRARLPDGNNNYTDLIEVTRSVGDAGGTGTGGAQQFDGTVRSIDRTNGLFTMSTNNYGVVTVSMPYNARSSDITRFNNLRISDFVRFSGVMLNNSRIELRQFL